MNDDQAQELKALREVQQDLRWRLDALDRRIAGLENRKHLPASPAPVVPPPLPVAPIVPERSAPPSPADELWKPQTGPPDLVESFEPAADSPPPLPKTARRSSAAEAATTDSLELRFGRVWLVRIGIVILLTGLVFLGNFAWKEFVAKIGPAGKLALLYLAGFGLGALGWLVKRKRAELAAYGKVLIGGGLATVYYATYAAHFVEPLRVISSPLLGGVILLGFAGGILWLADRLRAPGVASATIVLGFYTAAINPLAGFSLFSNLVLSVIAIILLARRRWVSVSFLSLAGCYLAFAFWRVHATGSLGVSSIADPQIFWTAFLFPACYWAVFTVATFLGRSRTFAEGLRPVFLTLNNGAFFALAAPLVAGTHPGRLWIFALAFGALLLGLAFLAAKTEPEENVFDGSYLSQGLVLVGLGFLFKFSGYQLAVIFALQSGMLLKLSRYRHSLIFQIFSGLSALAATVQAMAGLSFDRPHGPVTAAGVALLLTAIGWMFKYQRGLLNPPSFQWRSAGYVALAMLLGIATVFHASTGDPRFYLLLALAVLGTASLYLLRMPELVFGTQAFAALAFLEWFRQARAAEPLPTAAAVLASLAFMHWWQGRNPLPFEKSWRRVGESFYAIAAIAVVFGWALGRFPEPHLSVAMALCALGFLSYALATRAWPLAVGSQAFSFAAVVGLSAMVFKKDPWPASLATLAIFASQALATRLLGNRVPERYRPVLHQYRLIVRAMSVLLGFAVIESYIAEPWQFVCLAVTAFGFFSAALGSRRPEALIYAAGALGLGIWEFLSKTGHPAFPPDFAGLVLILIAQRIGRRRLEGDFFGPWVQSALIVLGVTGIWILMGRMVATVENGFLLTISWSLLAFLVLGAGFALKERTYRLLGLGILIASIGRIFFIDVWHLETFYRILSFLVLGGVLLALGFLYNRFAEAIRKWI